MLEQNKLFKLAFNYVFFTKLSVDGYCDFSVITRCDYSKAYMKERLKMINSPLAKIYELKYEESVLAHEFLSELNKCLLYLEEIRDSSNIEFICFSIVYFVYKAKEYDSSYIKNLYERWSDEKNENEHKNIKLKIFHDIAYDSNRVDLQIIDSISNYRDFLKKTIRTIDEKVFYRGHSDCSYKLEPSLFRKLDWISNENRMNYELISRCQEDFYGVNSSVEKLSKMQHYGLPTRLLDITQNPLVALYFACLNNEKRGEVIVLNVEKKNIEYTNGYKASLLAALSELSKDEQDELYMAIKQSDNISCEAYSKLLSIVGTQYDYKEIEDELLTQATIFIPMVLCQDLVQIKMGDFSS